MVSLTVHVQKMLTDDALELKSNMVEATTIDFSNRVKLYIRRVIHFLYPSNCRGSPSQVLAFPKLNGTNLKIVEEIITESFPDLVTIVVGAADSKRIVLCSAELVKRNVLNEFSLLNRCTNEFETFDDNSDSPNHSLNAATANSQPERENISKSKKPERALYVCPAKQRVSIPEVTSSSHLKNQGLSDGIFSKTNVQSSTEYSSQNTETRIVSKLKCFDIPVSQPETDEFWSQLTVPQILEVVNITGPVQILKPVWLNFGCDKQIQLKLSTLGHILEVYDFPASFTTGDIEKIFYTFRENGFKIKWVDDTHALLVFRDSATAVEASYLRHPQVKSRNIVNASRGARLKIQRGPEFVLPYKERPKTVTVVAKRLITSALGNRVKHSEMKTGEENETQINKSLKSVDLRIKGNSS